MLRALPLCACLFALCFLGGCRGAPPKAAATPPRPSAVAINFFEDGSGRLLFNFENDAPLPIAAVSMSCLRGGPALARGSTAMPPSTVIAAAVPAGGEIKGVAACPHTGRDGNARLRVSVAYRESGGRRIVKGFNYALHPPQRNWQPAP